MKRKICRVFLTMLFVGIVIMNTEFVNAKLGEDVDTGILNPILQNPGNNRINGMFNTIATTVVRVCQLLAVAGLAFNGFKYMSAGAEGKSKIKENLLWIFFGLLLVTSADAIIRIVSKIGEQGI